jgi:Kef-type K+ transport system membrane component KefB
MTPASWYLLTGLFLLFMALGGLILRRLPLTSAVVYLTIGVALGPLGFGVLSIDAFAHSRSPGHQPGPGKCVH